jgi:hypothetical protein
LRKEIDKEDEEILNKILSEFEGLSQKEREKLIKKTLTREVKRAAGVLRRLEGEEASRDFVILYTLLSMTEGCLGLKTSQVFKVACAVYGAMKGKKPGEVLDYIL